MSILSPIFSEFLLIPKAADRIGRGGADAFLTLRGVDDDPSGDHDHGLLLSRAARRLPGSSSRAGPSYRGSLPRLARRPCLVRALSSRVRGMSVPGLPEPPNLLETSFVTPRFHGHLLFSPPPLDHLGMTLAMALSTGGWSPPEENR